MAVILFCEDEHVIRTTTTRMLEELGHKVIIAVNGAQALAKYRESSKEIDAVILDNLLPDLTGYEVFKELKNINPEVRVIMCSGYSVGREYDMAREAGIRLFLFKPYTLEELLEALQMVLNV
jgi:two-component system cell cycle sensor histidine kinase/response regulator CckA